jgi:hypothetical protein
MSDEELPGLFQSVEMVDFANRLQLTSCGGAASKSQCPRGESGQQECVAQRS